MTGWAVERDLGGRGREALKSEIALGGDSLARQAKKNPAP
jgi:hypothetical protein